MRWTLLSPVLVLACAIPCAAHQSGTALTGAGGSGSGSSGSRAVHEAGGAVGAGAALAQRLAAAFNAQAGAIGSISARVEITPTPGRSYGKQANLPHAIPATLLAQRPGSIRLRAVEQAAVVGVTLFDLASDGHAYELLLPSRHRFFVGSDNPLTRPPSSAVHVNGARGGAGGSAAGGTGDPDFNLAGDLAGDGAGNSNDAALRAIENVRPQHLLEALLWPALSEETELRLTNPDATGNTPYQLDVLGNGAGSGLDKKGEGWVERSILFDRQTLQVVGFEIYELTGAGPSSAEARSGGSGLDGRGAQRGYSRQLVAEIRLSDWQTIPPDATPSSVSLSGAGPSAREAAASNSKGAAALPAAYPGRIMLHRFDEDYQLDIAVIRVTLNGEIPRDRFHLQPQPGTQVTYLDSTRGEPK